MDILFYILLRTNKRLFSSVHVHEVLGNLSRLGHNIECVNTKYPMSERQIDDKQPLLLRKYPINTLLSSPLYKLLKGEIDLFFRFLTEIRIFLLAFILMVRRKGKFDVIYRRHYLFNSEYLLARLFRIPSVKEVNGRWVWEARISGGTDKFSLWLINRIERFSMPKGEMIIAVTPKLAEMLHTEYGVHKDKIVVIENGANTDLFIPMDVRVARSELGLNQNDNYICLVGAFSRWQGIEYLIRSAPSILKSFANTRFLLVGDGELKEELIELVEQIGISSRVIFTGIVPYERVPLYMNASDVCVVTKPQESGGFSPLKLCEYMACSKAVVATSASGLDFLEENNAGILANPENSEEFAQAIIKLLRDPGLRQRMGENGMKYVVENRSWKSVAKRVEEVCRQAIEQRKLKSQGKGKKL